MCAARRLSTGMTALPWATSSAPPAQKSFCTSTMSSAGLRSSCMVLSFHISMSLPVPSALATDLYQLTMMAGYEATGHVATSTFELFVRALPASRRYLMAAGLAQALDYLEGLRFIPDEIAWLRTVPALAAAPVRFFDEVLPAFRFTGDVWAMDEGEIVFPHEPLVRVTAPVMEAQIVETALLAILTFQTSVASKASRVVSAAAGR